MYCEQKAEEVHRTAAVFRVLGVQVHALQIPDVIHQMEAWISHRCGSHFIAVTNVHVLMEARHNLSFRRVLDSADLCVPDGMPLVWIGRSRGYSLKQRVYGPDLLLDFCRETNAKGYHHFFYGGAVGRFQYIAIAGTQRVTLPSDKRKSRETLDSAAPRCLADFTWCCSGVKKTSGTSQLHVYGTSQTHQLATYAMARSTLVLKTP